MRVFAVLSVVFVLLSGPFGLLYGLRGAGLCVAGAALCALVFDFLRRCSVENARINWVCREDHLDEMRAIWPISSGAPE